MQFLAGLTRVRYVFYYPETKDIVLAGPAEGWAADAAGRVCGIESGRPVVAIARSGRRPAGLCARRAPGAGDPGARSIRRRKVWRACSSFCAASARTPRRTTREMIVNGLRTSLGMQNIRVGGVAPNTHFAQVLLECDYRMKLIGIGLEKPPVQHGQLRRSRHAQQQPQCAAALVLHSRLQLRARGGRQPGPGTGRRRREARVAKTRSSPTTAAAA